MKSDKGLETPPIKEVGVAYSSAPRTHFLYEYEGEREIHPSLLVTNGINLWHEQMLNIPERDVSHLWAFAEKLLADRHDTLLYSYVEWLRYEITMGAIVPEKWDRRRPYPYKWMLISAVYFQEGDQGRAWHLIAIAYYQLGMNTTPTLTQAMSKAASSKHAISSMRKRGIVLAALEKIKSNKSIKSVVQAKEAVYHLIERSDEAMAVIEELDALTPEKTKFSKENDALDRLRNTLDSWASAKGPYPEMFEAFSYFSKKTTSAASSATRETKEGVPAEFLPEDCKHYMRFISYLESGYVMTAEVSRTSEGEIEVD